MDKTAIKKAFSKAAESYDRYSCVQSSTAKKLIQKITTNNIGSILEVGCGTGNYTQLLKNKFPQAKIKAVDISEEMVAVAKKKLDGRGIDFISADAEKINFRERFCLITSNAALQWFSSLKNTLVRYKAMLKEGGVVCFSMFGPLTFKEMRECLNAVDNKLHLPAETFIDYQRLKENLKIIFNKISIDEEIITKYYSSLGELLRHIKYTSATNNNLSIWTPDKLIKLEKVYREKFNPPSRNFPPACPEDNRRVKAGMPASSSWRGFAIGGDSGMNSASARGFPRLPAASPRGERREASAERRARFPLCRYEGQESTGLSPLSFNNIKATYQVFFCQVQ